MKDLQAIVRALAAGNGESSALATLVSVEGSSYRRPGARLLLRPDGTRIGSISGGCLEEDVLARARQVLASGQPDVVVYDTTSENDLVWGVGLGCHGVVRVLIEKLPPHPTWATTLADVFHRRQRARLVVAHGGEEPLGTELAGPDVFPSALRFVQTITPPLQLAVFGAGDDARPLVRFAQELGWSVVVCDPRPAFATVDRFPGAQTVIAAPTAELVHRANLDQESAAVVMTHHYVHDVPLLRQLLPLPLRYLGLLGPRKRAMRILDDLAREGLAVTTEQRAMLHAPVGLDLGADGAEEVALAIVAEIQSVLARRDGRPLRERTSPIHSS